MRRIPASVGRTLAILLAIAAAGIATAPNLLAAPADCDGERQWRATARATARAEHRKPPPRGGVYVQLDDKGTVVRTGKATDLLTRCGQHARHPELVKYTFKVVFRTDDDAEQGGMEQILDETFQPPLNKQRAVNATTSVPRKLAKNARFRRAAKAVLAKASALAPPPLRALIASTKNLVLPSGAPLALANRVVLVVYREGDSLDDVLALAHQILSESIRAARSGTRGKHMTVDQLMASPSPWVAVTLLKLPAKAPAAPGRGLGSTVAANVAAAEADVTADADAIDKHLEYLANINKRLKPLANAITVDLGLVGTALASAAVDESTLRAREANPARPRVVSATVVTSPNLPAPASTAAGADRGTAVKAARSFDAAVRASAAQPPTSSAPSRPSAPARPAPALASAFGPSGSGAPVGSVTAAESGDLGGIDFSSLELRYISDASTQSTRATAFAFKGVPGRGGRGGAKIARRVVRESSDAFFVWLALPTTSFTVNLNPSEPDRIVDPELGRTDAGRILLEADLRMKKTVARLIHPDRQLGERFWAALDRLYEAHSARVCLSFRQWIVPAPATVSESRGELYILKAPLHVKMESDYRSTRARSAGGQRDCPGESQALQQRAESLYRGMILPRVQRAVRSRPEYAALRRVYLARVAAEWYRRLGAREGGAFVEIIDSGDISHWRSKRPWRPRDVFDRYVRSFRRGEFRVTRSTQRGNVVRTSTLVYGGVDFTNAPLKTVSTAELRSLRPELPAMLARALSRPVVDRNRGEIWLAGASVDQTFATSDPELDEDSSSRGPLIPLAGVLLLALAAASVVVVRRTRS